MTFDIKKWGKWNSHENKNAKFSYMYDADTDDLATVKGSGYFNEIISRITVGSLIYVVASDAVAILKVTSVTTNVATETFAGGAAASVVYAGEHTTVGGAAAEAITVTGVLATDLVVAVLKQVGASPQTILTSVPTADTVTVTFSADPSTDHIITYIVYRAI